MKISIAVGLVAALVIGLALANDKGLVSFGKSTVAPRALMASERNGSEAHSDEEHEHEEQAAGKHEGHRDHVDGIITLPGETLKEVGIEVGVASGGQIKQVIVLTGEVEFNADRVAELVPRVAGVVRDVRVRVGDTVKVGDLMAVFESRELAEAKSSYLAAKQRLGLARATYTRSEQMRAKGVLPELEFLNIRKERDEAEIEVRTAEYRLHALGLTDDELSAISDKKDDEFLRYEIRAPFGGTVVARHITLGEVVSIESEVFVLADLSSVWVKLAVYQKDMTLIRDGQSVVISAGDGGPEALGVIEYVSPLVEESTRTVAARVVLENPHGLWRPGLFVTGTVNLKKVDVEVLVPKSALQTIDEQSCVFVQGDEGFEPRPVTVGASDVHNVEVTRGLSPGTRYVTAGAFSLKAELGKEVFGEEGHSH